MVPGPIGCGNDVDPHAQPIGIPKIGLTRESRWAVEIVDFFFMDTKLNRSLAVFATLMFSI